MSNVSKEGAEDAMALYGIDAEKFIKDHNATSLRILRDLDINQANTDTVDGRITVVVDAEKNIVETSKVWYGR